MAAHKERVSFLGVIRGQEQEATCTVDAIKTTLPGAEVSALSNYSIRNVSRPLPDGNYEMTVQGETIRVRLNNGFWLAA